MEFVISLLRYSAPVGIAALGETVSQRSGLINIGLEGMMLAAAFFSTVASIATGNPWLGLGAGILAAAVLAVVQGFFTIRMALDQVVVGTGINLFALGLTSTLFRRQFGASGKLVDAPQIPATAAGLDAVMVFMIVAVLGVSWLVYRSRWGLLVRASGEYPPAAEAAGYSVARLRWGAVLIGAIFAGIAGSYLSIGIAGSFAENMTVGRGFVAISMVTFGRWKPIWVAAASLLVGYANSLQFGLQAKGLQLPTELFVALPYLVALAVLVVVGKGTAVPAALGIPFRRGS